MSDSVRRILLVSGLHSNEHAAPIVAKRVFHLLHKAGERVDLREVPYELTLLANLDEPENARPDYCIPKEPGLLDMDLEALVASLVDEHPGAVVFEFHNVSHTWDKLGITPDMRPEDFEVGVVAPQFTRPFQIGTWRNTGGNRQYLIELPAVYKPVVPAVLERRLESLRQLEGKGCSLREGHMAYIEKEVDLKATRDRGFLSPVICRKVADWIAREVAGRNQPLVSGSST